MILFSYKIRFFRLCVVRCASHKSAQEGEGVTSSSFVGKPKENYGFLRGIGLKCTNIKKSERINWQIAGQHLAVTEYFVAQDAFENGFSGYSKSTPLFDR